MATSYLLADDARNPSYAKIDGVTINKGGPPVNLESEQIVRLHRAGLISQADLDGDPLPEGPLVQDVFLADGVLSRRGNSGEIIPVSGAGGSNVIVQEEEPEDVPVATLWVEVDGASPPNIIAIHVAVAA